MKQEKEIELLKKKIENREEVLTELRHSLGVFEDKNKILKQKINFVKRLKKWSPTTNKKKNELMKIQVIELLEDVKEEK